MALTPNVGTSVSSSSSVSLSDGPLPMITAVSPRCRSCSAASRSTDALSSGPSSSGSRDGKSEPRQPGNVATVRSHAIGSRAEATLVTGRDSLEAAIVERGAARQGVGAAGDVDDVTADAGPPGGLEQVARRPGRSARTRPARRARRSLPTTWW